MTLDPTPIFETTYKCFHVDDLIGCSQVLWDKQGRQYPFYGWVIKGSERRHGLAELLSNKTWIWKLFLLAPTLPLPNGEALLMLTTQWKERLPLNSRLYLMPRCAALWADGCFQEPCQVTWTLKALSGSWCPVRYLWTLWPLGPVASPAHLPLPSPLPAPQGIWLCMAGLLDLSPSDLDLSKLQWPPLSQPCRHPAHFRGWIENRTWSFPSLRPREHSFLKLTKMYPCNHGRLGISARPVQCERPGELGLRGCKRG